jgi:hypothetical protein
MVPQNLGQNLVRQVRTPRFTGTAAGPLSESEVDWQTGGFLRGIEKSLGPKFVRKLAPPGVAMNLG